MMRGLGLLVASGVGVGVGCGAGGPGPPHPTATATAPARPARDARGAASGGDGRHGVLTGGALGAPRTAARTQVPTTGAGSMPTAAPALSMEALAEPFALHLPAVAGGARLGSDADERDADRRADATMARLRPAAQPGGDFAAHRGRFEAAMDADLGHVHVRTEDEDGNRRLGAVAHARDDQLSFAPGAFQPGTPDGDRLIAHELAHTQQAPGVVRRRVCVGGHVWTDDDVDLFLERLAEKYPDVGDAPADQREHAKRRRPDAAMRILLRQMAASATPVDFPSVVELERMLVMRQRTVASLDHPASCAYPRDDIGPMLNPRFWESMGGRFDWRVRKGVLPSMAIRSVFDEGDDPWRLECFTMTAAAVYKGQLDALGDDQFDRHYPHGLVLSTDREHGSVRQLVKDGLLEIVSASSAKELQMGDWVYFKNDPRYRSKHPGGYWQGENTVCLGQRGGEPWFRGFGIEDTNEQAVREELAAQFNQPVDPDDGIEDSLARALATPESIPGPLLDRVRRPSRSAVETR